MTVQQLADRIDVGEKTVRHWLREQFPKAAPGGGAVWELTPEMIRYVETMAARMKARREARRRS